MLVPSHRDLALITPRNGSFTVYTGRSELQIAVVLSYEKYTENERAYAVYRRIVRVIFKTVLHR